MINFIECKANVTVTCEAKVTVTCDDKVCFVVDVDKFVLCFEYHGEVWLIAERGGERCIVAQLNNDLSFHFVLTDKSEFTLS